MALEMPRNSLPPFLQKLRTITETVSSDIASWSEDGKSYVVHKPDFENILKQYFKGNLQTFVRQLHFYGFRKLDAHDGKWSFAHKSFRRDYPHLLFEIKRKTRNEPGEGAASQAEVQSLRTQVAYLQDVVEELRTQLECVLSVVENDNITPEEIKARKVPRVGAKRQRNGVRVKDEFDNKCEAVSKQMLDVSQLKIDPLDVNDAGSLGSITSEELMDVIEMEKDLNDSSSQTSASTNASVVPSEKPNLGIKITKSIKPTSIKAGLSKIIVPRPSQQINSPKSQLQQPKVLISDEAKVAKETQLDASAVSKVLNYLRVAAVKLATSSSEFENSNKKPTPIVTKTTTKPTTTTEPTMVKQSLSSGDIKPTLPPKTIQRQASQGCISQADQCAVLLPLLLHIPQVQSTLMEWRKFGTSSLAPSMTA